MGQDIKVSVICNTYNQVNYIEDALNGFVSQITDFEFEVLIHDDASTDGTQKIIEQFHKRYPHIIKPIYQDVNQYRQHISILSVYQLPRAKGKYIAFCEGDDYWTSPYKLQKQFEVLENYIDVDACSHQSSIIDSQTGKLIGITAPLASDGIIPIESIINAHGQRVIETASLFVRREVLEKNPPFREVLRIDTTLRIMVALKGGVYFINENMSVYRWLAKGSWTSNQTKESLHILHEKMMKMLYQLDIDTNGKYHNTICKEMIELEFNDSINQDDYSVLSNPQYSGCVKSMTKKRRIKIFINRYFPFVRSFYHKIKKT